MRKVIVKTWMIPIAFMQRHAPFLCKFCGQATIVYSIANDHYVDVDTNERHKCKCHDGTGYFINVSQDADNRPCFFCHNTKDKRAVVHYQVIMQDKRRQNHVQVVCESCSKKIFYTLASSSDELEE